MPSNITILKARIQAATQEFWFDVAIKWFKAAGFQVTKTPVSSGSRFKVAGKALKADVVMQEVAEVNQIGTMLTVTFSTEFLYALEDFASALEDLDYNVENVIKACKNAGGEDTLKNNAGRLREETGSFTEVSKIVSRLAGPLSTAATEYKKFCTVLDSLSDADEED